MITLDQIVDRLASETSDINEHLYTLKNYARQCDHVTEFGVGPGRSTAAFLSARPQMLRSYDFNECLPLGWWPADPHSLPSIETDWRFILGDSREVEIEATDLLFIDSWHLYDVLRIELQRHQHQVRRWIILHDTVLFPDMVRAVYELLCGEPSWTIVEHRRNNNGLMVLERIKCES
jgi:hypothetical protein